MATKATKNDKTTELVRVEKQTFDKVKKYVTQSKQSMGGFYTLAAEEKLQKYKKWQQLKTWLGNWPHLVLRL